MADDDYDSTYVESELFMDEYGIEWFLVGLLDPNDNTFDGEENYVDDQGRMWLRSDNHEDDDLVTFDEDVDDEEVEDQLTRR
jgi:hypothetical protein